MSLKNTNEKLPFYAKKIDALIEELQSDNNKGLSDDQLEKKYLQYGYNELPDVKKNLWRIYLAPIFNFLILILIISGILIIILGSASETIITFVVIFINSITAIVQQFRAHKALDSLKKISSLNSIVIRNNEEKEIPSKNLLPGDIVLINQGSKIPADGRIIECHNLSINEAPLTGESKAVEKKNNVFDNIELPIQKQKNMVFMGTYVQTGRAKIIITETGIKTKIGEISNSLNKMGAIEEIPLTKKLNKLGYFLGLIVIINMILLVTFKLVILHLPVGTAFTNSIIRAMNIMPVNLPLLVTLVLITGVLNMAKNGVIIKNLSSIESLGRVSVICSDKTGTITKNEMTVEKFWINNLEYEVSGTGYNPEGYIYNNELEHNLNSNTTFHKFIESMIINNNAKLVYEDVKVKFQETKLLPIRKALGSPTEASLLVLAEKIGILPYDLKNNFEIIKEFPFNSELKRMSTICKENNNDKYTLYSKGAPEIILNLSSYIEINGKINQLNEEIKKGILENINIKTTQGYRILAIAYRNLEYKNHSERNNLEKELIFLGFLSIIDPPRIGVKNAVEKCHSADIKVVMITGDHPNTARTIAKEMGIYNHENLVIEGKEIKALDKKSFDKVTVFARVAPSDKEYIIKEYQKEKKIVAMTGDGINDVLALKLANCGIAMGITGTDVAKETSDMVISDDNFISIKKGVKIGRGLFSKIRVIIYFFICLNILEGVIMFSYEFNPTFALFNSNWQHIYIFTIAHSFTSLALVIDISPKDIMKEPPRNEEELLNRNTLIMLLIQAIIIGISLVLALELTLNGVIPLNEWNLDPNLSYLNGVIPIEQKARTMFMTTLFLSETMFIWTFRRPNKSIFKSIKEEFSKSLFFACIFTLSIHILLVNFSNGINTVINDDLGLDFQLNFIFLSLTDWLICIGFAIFSILLIELFKYFFRKKKIIF
ncbi:MAG: cation-transporting P-type ATPase [Candidatus Lokiarchaeota archaeon]|nr:cation-transporting P-type ATPase [Candidatus Lokiarchaeota archaeon]